MKTAVIEYDYRPEAGGDTGDLLDHFGLDRPGFPGKWGAMAGEFDAGEERDVCCFFMAKVEAGELTGSEILAFAVSGFKGPIDAMRTQKRMKAILGEVLGNPTNDGPITGL